MSIDLIDQFKKYVEIIDDSTSDEIILDSCDLFTPANTLPLICYIRSNSSKSIRQHENPKWNDYLWETLHIKKPYGNAFYPIMWIDDNQNNSEIIKEHIFKIMPVSKDNLNDLSLIFNEILDNTYNYSDFDMGFVMSQYFPEINKSIYSFIDNGVGINDLEKSINSNGSLSKIKDIIISKYFGSLLIVSNSEMILFEGNNIIRESIPENYFKGTLVCFII